MHVARALATSDRAGPSLVARPPAPSGRRVGRTRATGRRRRRRGPSSSRPTTRGRCRRSVLAASSPRRPATGSRSSPTATPASSPTSWCSPRGRRSRTWPTASTTPSPRARSTRACWPTTPRRTCRPRRRRTRSSDPAEAAQLTPVDYGDVCVNVDDVWFARARRSRRRGRWTTSPNPDYRGLFVTPGRVQLLAGAGVPAGHRREVRRRLADYWKKLMANGAKITSGWSDAYEVDFTAGGGDGDRPIVLSYASSPPFTIPKGGSSRPRAPARHLLPAGGVRRRAEGGDGTPRAPRRSWTSCSSAPSRRRCPTTCTSSRSTTGPPLPATWAKFAKVAPHPYAVDPREIAKNRDTWLREWGDVTIR